MPPCWSRNFYSTDAYGSAQIFPAVKRQTNIQHGLVFLGQVVRMGDLTRYFSGRNIGKTLNEVFTKKFRCFDPHPQWAVNPKRRSVWPRRGDTWRKMTAAHYLRVI